MYIILRTVGIYIAIVTPPLPKYVKYVYYPGRCSVTIFLTDLDGTVTQHDVFLVPQVSGLMPNTYLVHEHKLERGSPRLDHKSCSPVRPTTVFCLIVLLITYTPSSYKKKKTSWHLQGNVNHRVCLLLLRRRRLLGTLSYPSFCPCFRGIQNRGPRQPCACSAEWTSCAQPYSQACCYADRR